METRGVSLSIRTKLILTFMAITLLPMAVMLYLLSLRLPESFERMSRPRIQNALNGIDGEIQRKIQSTRSRVEDIAENQLLIEKTFLYEYGPMNLIDEAGRIRDAAGLDVLNVIDPRGTVLASGADRAWFGVKTNNAAAVREAIATPPIILIERTRVLDRDYVSLNVYQPILYDGRAIAVLVGGSFLDVEYVRMLEDLSAADVMLYVGTEPAVSVAGSKIESIVAESGFLKTLESEGLTSRPIALSGRKYILGGVPIRAEANGEPLGYLVMALSLDKEEKIVADVRRNILMLALVVALASILAGALLSYSLTRPIARLVNIARRIGHGKLDDIEINVKSRDEIGLLGAAFQRMMRDLREHRECLVMTERTAAWRDMARSIAHEIKNPLSPIQLSVENLKISFANNRKRFDEIFPECSDTVLEEVERLRRMATEFSDFARMPLPKFEEVALHEVVESAANLFRETAESRNIKIIVGKPQALRVQGDRGQLTQVFENILKNSLEALADGGEIRILEKEVEGKAAIVVEDNGPGIPEENLQSIFRPYFTTKSMGTGLGLPIVQRILNDHGASIEVHSDKEVGTWIVITFPEPGTMIVRRDEAMQKNE